jgi:4-azaleucine resistance transporter AzlC
MHPLRKFYMMFSLTDETYALLSSAKVPDGLRAHDYYFCVSALNQSYWILGSVLGAAAGQLLGFDTTGVDFAMTALFIVIAVSQWRAYRSHLPALLGAGITLICLALFGADNMLMPALGVMVLALILARPRLDIANRKEGASS